MLNQNKHHLGKSLEVGKGFVFVLKKLKEYQSRDCGINEKGCVRRLKHDYSTFALVEKSLKNDKKLL